MRLHPDHLGTGNHYLAGDRVTEREHGMDHFPLVVLDDASLFREVDKLAQLDLGRERSLPEALAGGDRVADADQQRGEWAERLAKPMHQRRHDPADVVRVLAADRSWPDADHDEAHDRHGA